MALSQSHPKDTLGDSLGQAACLTVYFGPATLDNSTDKSVQAYAKEWVKYISSIDTAFMVCFPGLLI